MSKKYDQETYDQAVRAFVSVVSHQAESAGMKCSALRENGKAVIKFRQTMEADAPTASFVVKSDEKHGWYAQMYCPKEYARMFADGDTGGYRELVRLYLSDPSTVNSVIFNAQQLLI